MVEGRSPLPRQSVRPNAARAVLQEVYSGPRKVPGSCPGLGGCPRGVQTARRISALVKKSSETVVYKAQYLWQMSLTMSCRGKHGREGWVQPCAATPRPQCPVSLSKPTVCSPFCRLRSASPAVQEPVDADVRLLNPQPVCVCVNLST